MPIINFKFISIYDKIYYIMFLYQSPVNENNYAKLEKLNLSIVLHIIS